MLLLLLHCTVATHCHTARLTQHVASGSQLLRVCVVVGARAAAGDAQLQRVLCDPLIIVCLWRLQRLLNNHDRHPAHQLRSVACDHPEGPQQRVQGREDRREIGLPHLPAAGDDLY